MILLHLLEAIARIFISAYERHVRRRELRQRPVYRRADLLAEEQADMQARLALFAPGARYRVVKTFKSLPSLFVEGEEVVFESVRYDPRDLLFAYIFASQTGAKTWVTGSTEPIDVWKDYFAPLRGFAPGADF